MELPYIKVRKSADRVGLLRRSGKGKRVHSACRKSSVVRSGPPPKLAGLAIERMS